jgi:hypothetical protein
MGQGYTRNDTTNNIANGNVISAADLDGEFDAIVASFNETTGHTHDGTAAEGGAVSVIGPVQEYLGDGTAFYPKTTAVYTLGKASNVWANLHLVTLTLSGTATMATVDINAGNIDNTVIGATTPVAGTFSTLKSIAADGLGTVNIVSTTNAVSAGNKIAFFAANRSTTDEEMAYIKPLLVGNNGGAGNVQSGDLAFGTTGVERMRIGSTGVVAITTADINGGNIDGTIIGATTPAAVTGTAITGTSFASTGNMTFGDSDKAIFGAGGDLQIFHDGGNSIIDETGTGDLFIRGTNINLQNRDAAPNENFITCVANGAVTITHNNLPKLTTTSSGVDVTGNANFDDNGKAIFGAGSDLQIFHNGNNSYVQDLGTGSLVLSSNGSAVVINDAADVALANFNQNGSVYLKHVNAGVATDRLTTTSGGVSINGSIGLTGTVDGRDLATDGAKLDAINQPLATTSTPTFNALNLSKVTAGFGNLEIGGSLGALIDLKAPFSDDFDARIQYTAGSNLTINTFANEPIQLNHQGTTRLATSNAGVNITGTTNITDALNYNGASDFYLRSRLNGGNVQIGTETPAGALYYPVSINGASDYTAFNTSTEEAMRITAGGNVGIGTTSPTTALDVVGKVSVQGANLGTTLANTVETLSLRSDTSNVDRLAFYAKRTAAGTTWTTAGQRIQRYVDTSAMGYMQFGSDVGDLITFGEAGSSEYMRIDGSGHAIIPAGITLGTAAGVYSAANTLDDYEEGSWTPALTFGGASVGITYSTQLGTYTKVGNMVQGRFAIILTNKGSSVGNALIGGLPFTVGSELGNATVELANNFVTNIASNGYCTNVATTITLNRFDTTSTAAITNSNFANNTRLDMWFQYLV